MPNFKLTADEANALAAWLNADATALAAAPTGDIARGKELVQTTGCLNCHTGPAENKFTTKPLAELAAAKWAGGCVAEKPAGKAPFFAFTAAERAALQAFAATDRASLTRHVPAEFAERQARALNCRECHGKFDGFPQLDHLGGKLRPEWSAQFLAGALKYKPRPWIESRMPAFASRATALAAGLAAQHGHPATTPAEPPIDQTEAKLGQKLVSSDGGFSCIACHAVGEFGATQVFESAGINLPIPPSACCRRSTCAGCSTRSSLTRRRRCPSISTPAKARSPTFMAATRSSRSTPSGNTSASAKKFPRRRCRNERCFHNRGAGRFPLPLPEVRCPPFRVPGNRGHAKAWTPNPERGRPARPAARMAALQSWGTDRGASRFPLPPLRAPSPPFRMEARDGERRRPSSW
jgi:cytochrome c2